MYIWDVIMGNVFCLFLLLSFASPISMITTWVFSFSSKKTQLVFDHLRILRSSIEILWPIKAEGYHDLQQIDSTILREYQQSLIVLENSGNFGVIFV